MKKAKGNLISEKELMSKIPLSKRVLSHYRYTRKFKMPVLAINKERFYNADEIMTLLGVKDLDEPMINGPEIAKLTKITHSTIIRYANLGLIPSYSFTDGAKGRRMFFRKSEVEASIGLRLSTIFVDRFGIAMKFRNIIDVLSTASNCLSPDEKIAVQLMIIEGLQASEVKEHLPHISTYEGIRQVLFRAIHKMEEHVATSAAVHQKNEELRKEIVKIKWENRRLRLNIIKDGHVPNIETYIRDTKLSPRVKKILDNQSLNTIAQLVEFGVDRLLKVQNFGRKCFEEVDNFLHDNNYVN